MVPFNWNLPTLLQPVIRCCLLFCSFLSILITLSYPFIQGKTITNKVPEYRCFVRSGVCPIGGITASPWEQAFLAIMWLPVHGVDLIASYFIIKTIVSTHYFDNSYRVIKNLLAFAAIKVFFIAVQHIQFITDGGIFGLELLNVMLRGVCIIPEDQVWLAYYPLLRVWFFTLNFFSSIGIVALVLANKYLAPYVHYDMESDSEADTVTPMLEIDLNCEEKDDKFKLLDDSDSDGADDWYSPPSTPTAIYSFI